MKDYSWDWKDDSTATFDAFKRLQVTWQIEEIRS
jgi:hypothetical protein